ncbi:MAG: S-layer homology domain-containing protein [Clostridia bacterium]|nr:S-layer homology domain-containing protein [Clostridia bacterium]
MSYEGLEVKTVQLTIRRAAAEVKSVVIDGDDTIAVPTKAEAQKEIPYTATVQDQYGTVLTGKTITWSIEDTALNGVTIDKNSGKVTILPAAAKNTFDENNQLTFKVKATCEGKSATKEVTLKREPSTVDGLTVSGGQDNIEIPADNSTNSSAAFTVAVTDQYGQPMDTPENVTWTIKDSTGNDVNSVTIDNGVVKVTSAAAQSITTTDGKEFTVTATGGGQFGTAKITVKREVPKVSQLMFRDEAIRDDSSYSVPTSYGTNGKEFWAIVFKDQYGAEMNVPAEDVTWTFPTLEGVSFRGFTSGRYHCLSITVNRNAAKNSFTNNALEFTVTASYKNPSISASMTCTLTRLPAQASSIELDGTDSDTVVIPSSNKKYTATVKDQYGLMMPGAQVTYSISPEDANVTIDSNGLVTVLDGATKDREYTITATYSQNVTATRTFKVVDKVSDTTTLKVEQADITFGESVNPQVTGAPAGTTAVTFTYEALEGSALTDGQPVNKGQYKVIARCESDTTIYTAEDTFEIKAKAITADMFTVTEKTYTYNGIGYDFEYQTTLVKNTDYTVTGTSHKDAGTYTVAFAGQGNYTGEVKVAWTIAPAVLKVKSVQLTSRTYDPANNSAEMETLTLNGAVSNDKLVLGTDYEVTEVRVSNNNVGTQRVSFKVTLKNSNYKWTADDEHVCEVPESAGFTVEITKAPHENATASGSAKYGSTAVVDISSYLPAGYHIGSITTGGNLSVFSNWKLGESTFSVSLANNPANVGKQVTFTLPISSTNYENFDLVITVTVNDKLENSLAARDISLIYGGTGHVTVTSIIGSLRTEIVAGNDVISLDNGTIKTLKAGEATLKLTASGDENYAEKSIQVKVTVSPKPITLTIDSKRAYVNDAQPALTYKVSGLVGADTLTTEPVLFVDVAEGVDPMKQVGTYAIKTSVTPSAGDNYSLTVAEGTLSVTNRPSAITPVGPSAGTVRVDETEGGTVRVTPANAAEGSTVAIVVTPDQGQELRSLEVLDKDGDSLELTDLGGGRFSFEMPRGKVTVKAEFGKAGLPYDDVKEGDWFYSAVEYVTEAGLMGDTGHGSFEPNTNTTRAMIWAILARLSGVDTTPVSGPWYSVAQEWAMNSGVSDGTNPNGAITREQLVTMLYRYAETHGIDVTEGGMAIREFADVERVSSFAGPAMTWAVNTGLISGIDGKLVPQGLATRSQVATVLMRFAQLAK